MKKLTQDIFKNAPEWVKSAAVDADGEGYFYSISKDDLELSAVIGWWGYRHIDGATCDFLGDDFDNTDWQNSAIDRVVR